jgi:ABC-type dipeptide/oligopeptide/nickel transport system permease component
MLDSIKNFDYKILISKRFILKTLLVIFCLSIISLLIIGLMDGDEIKIKNSDRRKISEKYDKEKENSKNNYFKQKNNQLRNLGKNISKKLRINQINK